MLTIAFFLDKNSGNGCQPRPSRGAYFTIFKVNWSTLASRRPDLSRINFCIKILDPICEDSNRVYIRIHECGDYSIASKDASRDSAQVLFKGHLICQVIERLKLHQERHPHFGGSIAVDELFVKVLCTV